MCVNKSLNVQCQTTGAGGRILETTFYEQQIYSYVQDSVMKIVHRTLIISHFLRFNILDFPLTFVCFSTLFVTLTCVGTYTNLVNLLLKVSDRIFKVDKLHYSNWVFRNLNDKTHGGRIFSYFLGGLAVLGNYHL